MLCPTKKQKKKGYFFLVLHSHIPYVIGQRDWPHGTSWLYEAAAESYLPLLNTFYDLAEEGVNPQVTLSLTPVLCEQLSHSYFATGLQSYIEEKLSYARQNASDFKRYGEVHKATLAERWVEFYSQMGESFENRFHRDLIGAFKTLQDNGSIEVITSAATHGYLPLLGFDECIHAQIKQGVQSYRRHFGRHPMGIWLPECAYRPGYKWSFPVHDQRKRARMRKGLEEFLIEAGIKYFIIDNRMLRGEKAIGMYLSRFKALQKLWKRFSTSYEHLNEEKEKTLYSIYFLQGGTSPEAVAVFTRDPQTRIQVWSGQWGYPGNSWYLDFHKKHHPGGLRYWRVIDYKADLADKDEYYPERVPSVVKEQADHFLQLIKNALLEHHHKTGNPGILTAPFDSELFGHWWFEGCQWLHSLLQMMNKDHEISPLTCGSYLENSPQGELITLPEGSWGEGGFHYMWLNDQNSWTWKKIYKAEERFIQLVKQWHPKMSEIAGRILAQAARELLLLESSDWQFLITTWSARDYAEERVSLHFDNFQKLCRLLEEIEATGKLRQEGEHFLRTCEEKDGIFADIDITWWLKK
ncbi:MAG: 1,4-alpha-glucan branching protein domain-containing protein [Acidobacteriota bacterium]